MLVSWNPAALLRRRWIPSPAQNAWGPLDAHADLVVETTGSAASTSFCAYLKKHNQSLRVTGHWHMSYVLFWARRNRMPTIFLYRDLDGFMGSMAGRYDHWILQRWTLALRWAILMAAAALTARNILRVSYEEIIKSPAQTVERLNSEFGTELVPGDDRLPRIKTQSPEDHGELIATLTGNPH